MNTLFLILMFNLSNCEGLNYDNPYDEINAYFNEMGLTIKGEDSQELRASKKDILIGLEQIYKKWGLEIDIDAPLTDEMIVCKPNSLVKKSDCITWTW